MNLSKNNQIDNKKDEFPFFSIIIPTKNRSFLVGYAVKSVLMQSFQDFEVIVVDNDDTEKTKNVIDALNDKKIRYFRTGKLSMPDNWDYGCQRTHGKYLLVLEDKMALKPNALEIIFSAIKKSNTAIITWEHDFFDEEQGIGHPGIPVDGKEWWATSDQIIESFVNCDLGYFIKYSPRGYNSCIRKEVVDLVLKGPYSRLCIPVAPDYTMAFQLLNHVDKIVYISKSLVTMGGLKYSNGLAFHKKMELGNLFLREQNKTNSDLHSHVPIKTRTTMNFLINDFIQMSHKLGGRLSKYQLNLFNYYIYIYDEIIRMQNDGAEISQEMDAWNKALSVNDDLFIKKVRTEIDRKKNLKNRRNWEGRFLYLIHLVAEMGLLNFAILALKSIHLKLIKERKFDNILEYVKTDY